MESTQLLLAIKTMKSPSVQEYLKGNNMRCACLLWEHGHVDW